MVFRRLLCLGSFPVCWRVANVTPIPKGPPSSSASNYRPISLIPKLSKVVEHLVSAPLWRFTECRGVLPTAKFAYRKGLGTCDASFVWHTFLLSTFILSTFIFRTFILGTFMQHLKMTGNRLKITGNRLKNRSDRFQCRF